MTNQELFQISGEVCSTNPWVSLLYLLLRDDVQPGRLESLVSELEINGWVPTRFTNGWLAQYAVHLVSRMEAMQ